jgi:hypothetical protein
VIFWWFNLITEPDKYLLPKMDNLAAILSSCTFFSKLDLKQGYHQIPIPATNIKMTAIITPFGLFQYTRMSFELQNTGQTFQGMMDGDISGLVGIFCYLDDIIVASADERMYHCCFQLLLECLRQFGSVLKVNKMFFGQLQLGFLGHSISVVVACQR